MPHRDPAKALQMLDLLDKFFDEGRRWIRGRWNDGQGRCCVIGAIGRLSKGDRTAGDDASLYLALALPRGQHSVSDYNDASPSYRRIAQLIERARNLAKRELAGERILRRAELETAPEATPPGAVLSPAPKKPIPVPQPSPPLTEKQAVCRQQHAEARAANIPVGGIPLAVLKYLSPARLAELRATAPGLEATLDRIERERQRKATIDSLKKSVAEAVKEPEEMSVP